MATFPTLRTGAVAQHPCEQVMEQPTREVRFLGGTSKRYVERRPRRIWRIPLSGLQEDELERIQAFYRLHQGGAIRFDFVDPFTGETVSNCRFDQTSVRAHLGSASGGALVLTVAEDY